MTTQTPTPSWPHDCWICQYIGSDTVNELAVDWYFCRSASPTVLGRFGAEPHRYWSMPGDLDILARERDRGSTFAGVALERLQACGAL